MPRKITSRVVIALEGSSRLDGFFQHPEARDFTVFTAVDGRATTEHIDFRFDLFEERSGRSATGGEAGCAASHAAVLARFAQEDGAPNDLMLVCEDDARFGADTRSVLTKVCRYVRNADMIVLASPFDHAGRRPAASVGARLTQLSWLSLPVGPTKAPLKYRCGRFHGSAWGAGMYLVSREAAGRYTALVRHHGLSWLADEYHVFAPGAGIDVHALVPNLCGWEGSSTLREVADVHRSDALSRAGGAPVDVVRSRLALRTRYGYLRRQWWATVQDAKTIRRRLLARFSTRKH